MLRSLGPSLRLSGLAVIAFAAAVGCSDQRSPALPPPASFQIVNLSGAAVEANGTNSVMLSVSGTTHDVTLTATRGTFADSGKATTTIAGGSGQATLVTCDSRTQTVCAGTVDINGVDTVGATGKVAVQFLHAEICNNGIDDNQDGKIDCADPECKGQTCQITPMSMGTCDDTGACVCTAGTTEICNDGVDNNCDGKIDCADPTCANKACKLPSGLSGLCTAGGCACPNMPEVCNDGIDNDCDGLVDCDDPDCQPQGNALGSVCDAKGDTCSPPQLTGGKSTCSVCGGGGGTPQAHESVCGDGHDNDCDGLIDCQDPDCANLVCNPNNKTCNPATLQCTCASTMEICNDHIDNNCDGLIDCADPQCAGQSCGANGMQCGGGGAAQTTCACSGNGGAAQTTETACGDGKDNDCNGLVDCADPACRPTAGQTFGLGCGPHGQLCDNTGTCVCPGGQTKETTCGDGQDNDCDGLIDCQDPDCNGLSCAAAGKVCASSACICPGGSSPETICNDGIDNDCNGVADCNDPACAGKQCGASGTQLCFGTPPNATCKDTTSQYSLVLTAQRSAIAADGAATLMLTATLKKDTTGNGNFVVQTNQPLSFSSDDTNAPVSPTSAVTDTNGQATTTLTSDASGGTATVTVSYTIPASTTVITATFKVSMPKLGQVNFVNQQYGIMGARYSGFQETNLITFQLLDSASNPYPAGLAVTFTHSSVGGSYLGTTPTPCPGGASNCVQWSGATDGSGQVQVLLHSGTVASVVSVSAGASAGGVSASGTASNIAIVGAKPSGAHISIDCTPKNVPALINNDCTNSQYFGTTINCTANLADRFNNVLGVSTLTTFNSEAGAAGPPASTPAYNPSVPPSSQQGLGQAKDFVSVGGYALPVDVYPLPTSTAASGSGKSSFPQEYRLSYVDSCGTRTHNPRDGLNTIIASAVGEEGFVDGSNGCPADGIYQGPAAGGCGGGKGENFIDMGEPFVDANDNGVRDANEAYVDANNNGVYDPPNGVWDATTVIWAQTRVVYTDAAHVGRQGGNELFSRFYTTTISEPTTPTPSATATFSLLQNTAQAFGIYFVDGNFNPPTSTSSYGVNKTLGNISIAMTQAPSIPDTIGMGFSVQYCPNPNRSSFDPSQTRGTITVSSTGDKVVTITGLSNLTTLDVGNYLTISGAAHPANDGVFAIASVVNPTTATYVNSAAADGDTDTVDWVNSQSDLSNCSNVCQSTPCFVVPHIANFHYGTVGIATITGASMSEMGESAQATCTTTNITVPVNITGLTQ